MSTALLSVFDKTGVTEFAKELLDLGWDLLASGGTAKHLIAAGLPVKDVADLVGGGPILGHRVVTLSREVHAGLLARPGKDDEEMQRLGIPYIDLVCINLYPLNDAVAKPDATLESVIEMTDIGGPTMLRSAAKGKRIVVCDRKDYTDVIDWLKKGEPNRDVYVNGLAAMAEWVVSLYCATSSNFRNMWRFQ